MNADARHRLAFGAEFYGERVDSERTDYALQRVDSRVHRRG